MIDLEADIYTQLQQLRLSLPCDFAAIGMTDERARRMSWRYTSGEISRRTALLQQRTGTGLAGSALRSGRLVILSELILPDELRRYDDPLLLAEKLMSAAAVPLQVNELEQASVLLIGDRSNRIYEAIALERMKQSIIRIQSILTMQV